MIFEKQHHKLLTSVLKTLLCTFVLVSFYSCSFLMSNEITESKHEETITQAEIKTSESGKLRLVFTPDFTGQNNSSRSAYPDFSNISALGFTFSIKSENLAETAGTYDSTTNKISFEIPSRDFTDEEFTVLANKSDKPLLFAKIKLSYTEGGASTTISDSINFKPYTTADGNTDEPPNGFVNLSISTSKNYTIECDIENNDSGNIQIATSSNSSATTCTLSTVTDGVAPGNYTARISIKSGSNIIDFHIQTIYVWPGMTTDCWYLSDGGKSSKYVIEVDSCKLYVMGENPTGIYSSAGLPAMTVVSPSDTDNDGSILKPFATIGAAIEKFSNDNKTSFIIICDGDLPGFTIGSSSQTTASKRKLTIKGGGNSNNYSSITSVVSFYTTNDIIFENLKFSNLSATWSIYGTFYTNAGKKLSLNNCIIENSTYNNIGIKCQGSVLSYTLELNDTKISCTKENAISISNTYSGGGTSILRIKGSTFIEPYFDESTNEHTNYIGLNNNKSKIIIDGPLTDSHQILGAISLSMESGYELMTAVNGADLAKESQRFEILNFPKVINTEGKIAISKDYYVASATSTPAGSSTGTGSSKAPLDTVTAAVALVKAAANTTGGAGDYTIHISGEIQESNEISLYSGKDVWELGDFEGSTLKLCGTNNSNDILDGTTNTTNPIIHLYNGTSSYDLIVTIENLTIQNATKGAIKLQDEHSILKLGHGCVITKNKDDDDGCGGIYNGGTVCIYDNAIIGKNANLINTNATNAIANGGNSPHGIYGGNVWIGYTDPSLDALDNSGNTCQIAGNCFSGIEMTGGTLYLGKGNIHHNYRNNGGGGVYLEHFSTMYMSGGTINNNSTDGNGGGVYVSGTTSSEFTMSGGVIEQNTAVTGGAIYNAGHFNISGDASIPAGDEGKNDVYLVNTRFINIADSLNPPPAANGISATFTPETYSETTTYIYDDTHGATVEQKYEKIKVTPQSVTIGGVAKKIKWKTTETGKIVIPFSATINSESYSTVASLIEALTDSAGPFNNQDITLTLEGKVSADELGKATVEGTIAYAIQNTVSNSIKLVIPSEAIVKLNSDSSNIFYNCKKLISADLSGFDTSESEYFGTMFANCSILKTLDLSSFVTSSVKYMDSTFGNCPELETIYVSNTFTTTSVNNSTNMFYNCTKLKGGEGTAYNSSKIDKTYARIDYGSSNPGYFTSVNDKPIDVTEETVDEVFANLHSGDNVIRINGSLNSNYIKALRTKIQNASNSIVLDFTAISDSNYSISSRNGTSVDSTYGDSFQSCTMLTKIIVSNNHKIYFSANAFKNCAYLATIKVIDSFDNTDSSYKCDSGQEPFAGCIRLKTLDFTECTTVKLVGTKFTTTTNTQDNSYTTEVRFGKKLYTLNINNSVAFTNENFKFEYQGTKSNWQTVSKTRSGTQKDPLKCHCAEDNITLTMDSLGIWSE